ncbi:MAG: hypothetical protein ACF8Q5_07490 [Phycisphaerales bacterium JB040]
MRRHAHRSIPPACLLACCTWGALAQPGAPEPETAAASETVSEYREDLADYTRHTVRGFGVMVHTSLEERDPDLLAHVLLLLEHDLAVIEEIVPGPAFEVLRTVTFWVESQGAVVPGGMSGRGMCFHASTDWVTSHGLLAEKTGGVEIVRAADFPVWRRDQPFMTFHELAHAYHHLLGVDDERIARAYESARESGVYEAVDRNTSTEPVRAYALSNRMEYFAELSEAYFGLNDYYPFTRRQLASHDPGGLEAVAALWNLPAEAIDDRVERADFMGQLERHRDAQQQAGDDG